MENVNNTDDIKMFMNLLFDKDTQEQFFEECKELGIIEDENEDTD